ncbi:MAG: hypothetical protein J6A44_04165 [Paludibacteraceae bacterium]|nr:hypothetical protein [Paludibacteraceae bacterium]
MKSNKNILLTNIFTIFSAFFFCFLFLGCQKKKANQTQKLLQNIQNELRDSIPEEKQFKEKIDSLLITNNPNILKSSYEYGIYLHNTGQQAKAIEFYTILAKHYQNKKNPTIEDYKNLILCYIPLGAAFEETGLKNTAMNYYITGLKIAESHDLQTHRAMLLNNIGVIYFGINEYNLASDYFSEASVINLKHQRNHELFINYNNLAEVYLKTNNLSKSMDYSLKALQYLKEEDDAAMYYMMHTNIGTLYALRNEYPMAISYLKNSIKHQKELGLTSYLITSYLSLADVYNKINLLDSANYIASQALKLAKENKNISLQNQTLLLQSKLAKENKNYAQSLFLLEEANLLNDSIQRLDNRKKMDDWETIYELGKKDSLNNSIISKWEPQTIIYFMLCINAIFICIIITLYHNNKNKNKKLKNQEVKELELQKEQTKLITTEVEKNKKIQEEIDQKNRQLTTFTLEKIRFNEHITEINTELKKVLLEINPRSKEHKERIQNLLNKLLLLENNNNWDEFHFYFEQVHPQFYEKLETQYPTLTSKEKRLCAFIALGLSTKEIADITFREVRSCESSRNRLRKKLGVEPDVDLTNFIRQITH